MTPEHKEALAKGRTHSRIVERYLETLAANKPKRGRKPSIPGLKAKLVRWEQEKLTCGVLRRVQLTQEIMDTKAYIAELEASTPEDFHVIEDDFVKIVKEYSEAKGISRDAWRKNHVPSDVLRRAGI